jgi:hypothetical protein
VRFFSAASAGLASIIDSIRLLPKKMYILILFHNTRKVPKLSQHLPVFTSWLLFKDGAVTFTFERELQDGEQYEMVLFIKMVQQSWMEINYY